MDQDTQKYIDSKFSEVEKRETLEREQALDAFKARQTMAKRFVFICAIVMLGLLGLMLPMLWKYQIAPRF